MIEWLLGLGWSDIMGIIGVVLYIGSYFGLQAGMIKGVGYLYAGLNAAAATCVLLSLAQNFNLSAAIIQVTYIGISLFGIIRFFILSHRIKFSEEEKIFIDVVAPSLTALDARRLLDRGLWSAAASGTLLTEEGKSPDNFFFLLDGLAKVEVAGTQVAELGSKSLVGEMSCLTGMEASATVCLTKPSRVFAIEIEKLNGFLDRNAAVRQELQSRFAIQISKKLIQSNAALSAVQ